MTTTSPSPGRRHAKRGSTTLGPALVWRRHDFRESSRLVTVLTRDHGLVRTLAKGAHRAKSPFLGRIDYLNTIDPRVARHGDAFGLRLLHGAKLLHEPRALREPRRFLAACHLTDFATVAFPTGRADPAIFDLVTGGVRLLERCPLPTVPRIALALEVRFLDALGELPAPTPGADTVDAPTGQRTLAAASRDWLLAAQRQPGRAWDRMPAAPGELVATIGEWIRHATDRKLSFRAAALAPIRQAPPD